MEGKGLQPEQIGMVFGTATAIRLISAPALGRIADRTGALRLSLAICCAGTAVAALGYLSGSGFWPLLAISLVHAVALAPTTNLADALALVASRRQQFEYGWARGAGSAAFIAGSILTGFAISAFGLSVGVVLQSVLMLGVPFALLLVSPVGRVSAGEPCASAGVELLLRLRVFRRVVLVAALILGSHALHDTFSVIRWTNAGISPQIASMLWSLSVAAEVIMFFFIGPWLLERVGAGRAIAIGAVAGAVRWLVSALTLNVTAITHPAVSRDHFRPCAPCLHASPGHQRTAAARRDSAGALWNGRHWRGDGSSNHDIGLAVRALGGAGVPADVRPLSRGTPPRCFADRRVGYRT
jgi:PPP family 3-phenylpropionic acid transporter